MVSCLYVGQVRHRRFAPKEHAFRYHMAYFYLDLSEVDDISKRLSRTRGVLAFRRRDYLGPVEKDLSTAVRDLVEERLGARPEGPIRLLTQISYFGFCFNPVSFYYCFDRSGQKLEAIIADVTNTPWNERHAYVVSCREDQALKFTVPKRFHVSPFMPMEIDYRWSFSLPGSGLNVHMENLERGTDQSIFDATMTFRRRQLDAIQLARTLVSVPLLTMKAFAAIYIEAVFIKLKGLRFYPRPTDSGENA